MDNKHNNTKEKIRAKMVLIEHYVCTVSHINELICEISDFSGVFVNNGFCVMQQLLLNLNPILSGAALPSIHLMNNGKFNPGLARSTWSRFSCKEKDKYSLL